MRRGKTSRLILWRQHYLGTKADNGKKWITLMNIHKIFKLHFSNLKINQCSSYSKTKKKNHMIHSIDLVKAWQNPKRLKDWTIHHLLTQQSFQFHFQPHTSSMDISHTLQISFSISSSSSICCSSSSELDLASSGVTIFRNTKEEHE